MSLNEEKSCGQAAMVCGIDPAGAKSLSDQLDAFRKPRARTITEEALQLSKDVSNLHENICEHTRCLRVFGNWIASVGPVPTEVDTLLRNMLKDYRYKYSI
jgi:hypothetical protein